MLKTFDVILDVEKELHHISMPAFTISQSDLDTVQITFAVNQDEAAFDLTDTTVQLAIKKPSGLTVYQNCSIADAINGEAVVILSKQAYIEYGFYTGELMISDLDQMLITCPFYYGVRTAIMAAQAEQSINDWSALETLIFETDKKPLIVDGVPTVLPEYTGQMAVDTTNRRAFIAYGLTAEDWQLIAAGEGGGGGIVYWTDILGKPTTFAPAAHTHTMADITDYTAPETGGGTWGTITGTLANQTDLQTALNGKADNTDLAAYAPTGHTHTAANITDFGTAIAANIPAEYLTTTEADAAYQAKGTYLTDVPAEYLTQTEGDARYAIKGEGGTGIAAAWGDIAGTLANQTDLQAALDAKADDSDLTGKADIGHTHTVANITDFGTGVAAAIPAEYLTETEGDTKYMAAGAAPTAHTHTAAEITDFGTAVAAAIPAEYLTETEGDTKYLTALPAHTHTVANITDFGTGVAAAIPAEYLTTTEADAAYQAKGTYLTAVPAEYLTETEGDTRYSTAGHTHTAANITDFGTAVAGAIPAEYVTTTEANAAYQAKGNYLTSVPLMSGAAIGGAQVGNGLAMSGNFLFVKTGAGLGLDAGANAIRVQTTRATPTPLNFWTGTNAEFTAIVTKDPNTLYFTTG